MSAMRTGCDGCCASMCRGRQAGLGDLGLDLAPPIWGLPYAALLHLLTAANGTKGRCHRVGLMTAVRMESGLRSGCSLWVVMTQSGARRVEHFASQLDLRPISLVAISCSDGLPR
jgi:hypothetical protein